MKTAAQNALFDGNEPDLGADAQSTDAMLVANALRGDVAAFETLVLRHQAGLFRRARWMGLDHDIAADMVQDALVRAYQNLRECRDPSRFHVWAGRILRNRCLDFFKSAERRGVPLPLTLPADSGNPETEHRLTALGERLQHALALLPKEQREAFLMKHGEDLSYEEMAELTGASVSAMKMRVHRAREYLRSQLGSFFDEDVTR